VPLGLLWEDTALRQRYLDARMHIARQVTARQDKDVLIVGASNLMLYRFALATGRDAWVEERTAVAGIPIGIIATGRNRFYLFDADDCAGCEQPLAALVHSLDTGTLAVHPVPFDTRFTAPGLWPTGTELMDGSNGG